MTALEKVLLLVSFGRSGELSKDDKSAILGQKVVIWKKEVIGLMYVCS